MHQLVILKPTEAAHFSGIPPKIPFNGDSKIIMIANAHTLQIYYKL